MSTGPPWLDTFRAASAAVEEAAAAGSLAAPVPWCSGVDVAGTLRHLGVVHRVVRQWVHDGHRPLRTPAPPADADLREWFATGWTALYDTLAAVDPDAEVSTWCSYDSTGRFWLRRMAHETAVHAVDVLEAAGWSWPVPEAFALDGVDEALRLWLGVALGPQVHGGGVVVRVTASGRSWTVGLNEGNVEVNHLPVPPDASVTAPAPDLYRWLWGRADGSAITTDGDPAAVARLRSLLARAMQ